MYRSAPQNIGTSAGTAATGVSHAGFANAHHPVNGEELLTPSKDVVLHMSGTELHVAAGSLVLVMHTPEVTAVYNLHDTRQSAVKLVCDGQEIHLPPGKALMLLTGAQLGAPAGHAVRSLGYRQVKDIRLSNGSTMIIAHFSVPSALRGLDALRRLQRSNLLEHSRIFNQILKTAAVLGTLQGQAEPYRPLPPLPLVSNR